LSAANASLIANEIARRAARGAHDHGDFGRKAGLAGGPISSPLVGKVDDVNIITEQ
jgi:hypothetical protein